LKWFGYKRVFFPKDNKAGENMNYKIIEVPEFNIIGKSKTFEFENFVKMDLNSGKNMLLQKTIKNYIS